MSVDELVSSAATVGAPTAKSAVPKRTEQTSMLYFHNENRWHLLNTFFVYRITFFIFQDSMTQIKLQHDRHRESMYRNKYVIIL